MEKLMIDYSHKQELSDLLPASIRIYMLESSQEHGQNSLQQPINRLIRYVPTSYASALRYGFLQPKGQ
jgi:predicted oxidoreductase (fatty acid repression mutant protein)